MTCRWCSAPLLLAAEQACGACARCAPSSVAAVAERPATAGDRWRAFAEGMGAGPDLPTGQLAIGGGDTCEGCDAQSPPDAYALGWRSVTGSDGQRAFLCPDCQRCGGES